MFSNSVIKSLAVSVKERYHRLMAAVTTVLLAGPVSAQGFISASQNLTRFFQMATITLVAGGVLGGLGVIAWAVSQMVKKGGQRGEDISWMDIGLKFVGGAFLLALAWVGTMVLETLGGNSGNIGRNL